MFVQCQSKVVDVLSELAVPNNRTIVEIFISATFDFTFAVCISHLPLQMSKGAYHSSDTLQKLLATLVSAVFDQIEVNMKSFLDCHPNIVFRGTEPRYFMEEKVNRRILRGYL